MAHTGSTTLTKTTDAGVTYTRSGMSDGEVIAILGDNDASQPTLVMTTLSDGVNTTLTAPAALSATSISVASVTNISVGTIITVAGNNPVAVSAITGLTLTLAAGLSAGASNGAAVTAPSLLTTTTFNRANGEQTSVW